MATKGPAAFLNIDKQILGDSGVSTECAENLLQLCDHIGPRFAGAPGFRRAAEFMLGKFEEYGLDNAALEPFEFTAWRRGAVASLAMAEPPANSYPCQALPYGAPTPDGGMEAEVVDIGAGSEAEIEARKADIEGRLAITTATARHRSLVYARCVELGAAGFVFSRGVEGMLLPTGTVMDAEEGAIPAVGIPYESGMQILRCAEKGNVRLRLTVQCSCERSTTWNVVGELPGTEFPDELVIMGGHLDSHDTTPGAVDNASGVVQVMEAARLLAAQRRHLKRTVRFIGFGAEEVGLLGSSHHARTHAGRLRSARFMLNSDCPSPGTPKGLAFHGLPQARPYIETLAEEMGTPIHFDDGFNIHSDHYPFIREGLPTAGMRSGRFKPAGRGFGHTAADTPDKISVTDLREGAAFAARILLRAASDERWPSLRRSPEQVEALLAKRDG